MLFEDKTPCATARYRKTEKGIKLERFAVLKQYRKKGYGNKILKRILEVLKHNKDDIYLHAQVQVVDFYKKQGFIKKGDIFSEAGIQHYKMIYN